MTTWSTTETVITWQSQDDASITFQVVKQNGGGGGAPAAHAASHEDGGSDELALDASQTTTGQFNVARLGTGTPSAFTFLNGLGEWTADVPVYVPVKNTSGSTIAKGAPVYATGTVGDTSTIEIAPADADDSAKMPAIGLTESELDPNEFGYVVVVGTLRGVDTQGLAINAPLYVSTTAGQLTITKPTGTSELIQNIGRVIRANQNSGEILVLGPGRTNDVPNAIDAGKLTSGTVATARLGSGTANSSSYLRGDQTWATITAGDVVGPASSVDGRVALFDGTTGKLLKQSSAALATIATSGSASDLSTGTVPSARLNTKVVGGQDEGSPVSEPSTATSLLDSTITLPACAAGDVILVNAGISLLQNSGGGRVVTFTVQIGSTSILASGFSVAASAATRPVHLTAALRVEGASDVNGSMLWSAGATLNGSATGVATENIGSGSLAFDLLVTGTGNATQTYTLEYLNVTRVAA